ncbi:hypothetical protein, variant [Aphanomyces invadans]|nr:hypothetical protein, variant [Aphanomyces invadans]ETV97128.1 hypothetical protein, variant [Aphanomyces invadans]|eukprot:XP_008874374.1 hypothetical protein, variant [Aphanomyces invadans]
MSDTVYPTTNPLDSTNRPIVSNLCSYILGNFATIEDVKRGIRLIQPTGIDLTQIGLTLHAGLGPLRTLPLHVAIHDASGASMAIEFLDGTMHLIDNPLGVLTNDPPLSVQLDRLAAASLHEGVPSGMSSTDRFVRLAKYNHVSSQDTYDVQTSFTAASSVDQSGVTRALHLLNTVVQPIISPTFATEWIVIRDHQNLHVYFQSTENSVLRRIDLNTVDWMDPTHRKTWPVASTASPWYMDVENEFAEVIVG